MVGQKAKLHVRSWKCQIKKKSSKVSCPLDEFLSYHTCPNDVMVISDDSVQSRNYGKWVKCPT